MVLNITKGHGKSMESFKVLNSVLQIEPYSRASVELTLMKRVILLHLAHKLKTAFMKLDICVW
jgi:hypothetical protein